MSNTIECDLQKTQDLFDLFQTPPEERDQDWLADFFETVPMASLRGFEPQIQQGPDGFPYLILSLPASDEDFDAFCVSEAVPFCLRKGCGIALFANPDKLQQPEWVFTFGSLWSFEQFGNFVGDPNDEVPLDGERPSEEQLKQPREIQIGAPSEDFLPVYARAAIARFLRETIGLKEPRVAQVTDPLLKPSRGLMFADLQPQRFENEEQFMRLMGALQWFLPATRGLIPGIPQLIPHAVPL